MCGKPLIAYTIQGDYKPKYIDRVIVSTDDDEIARIPLKVWCRSSFHATKSFSFRYRSCCRNYSLEQ
ncbi:cytidylyltransferase domain-containing protein [Bacteroides hominis]|uniref:cytidylyltransferase domain-containing protein n=1 Tax=Bacteroides hominis TaxID=2763023 RepID=UPI003D6D49C4